MTLAVGSIPACTGNPYPTQDARLPAAVYPRVYGESRYSIGRSPFTLGLSPRVRGILELGLDAVDTPGSIPACTGNPFRPLSLRPLPVVYPRVYGESTLTTRNAFPGGGLSPRVRGILARGGNGRNSARSIPACTGNPRGAGRTVT